MPTKTGRSIQENSGARDVALKPALHALANEASARTSEFG
jgi:hypothetical protein